MPDLKKIKEKINTPGQFDQVIYIISHPRSGNTFLRYILEHILRFRSFGYIGSGDKNSVDNVCVLKNKPDEFWDESGLIRKRHKFYDELEKQTSPKKVIFLIRSPIDLRERDPEIWDGKLSGYKDRAPGKERYIQQAQKYLDYTESPKMLLRYEELVSCLPKVIDDVLKFLEFENDPAINQRKKDFFKNIDEHIKLSRKRAPESRKAKVLGYEKQLDEENIAARWKWLEKLWKPDYSEAFVFIENLYKGVIGIDTDSSTFFSNKSL